jgi:aminoglycoside/choline kinase family phosphotransferase
MNNNFIKKEFLDSYFNCPYQITSIPGDCSHRSYDRIISNDDNFILMNAPIELIDLDPFIKIDNFLFNNNFSVPKIYKIDKENGFLLSEDFGNKSFNNILSKLSGDKLLKKEQEIYQYATDLLIELHQINLDNINLDNINLLEYNNNLLLEELKVFIDYYLKFIKNQDLSEIEKKNFKNIWLEILSYLSDDKYLVLRDYHADNLFFLDDRKSYRKIGLIDFQDAVLGSRAYDLVSFLQDARRDVSQDLQKNMIDDYIEKSKIDKKQFIIDYQILSLQRNIKILGIFARQGIKYKNTKYLDLIPRVLNYVISSFDQNNIFNNLKIFLKWQ